MRLRTLAVLAAAVCVCLLTPASSFAHNGFNDYDNHHLKYGVGAYGASNQHYYIAPSAAPYESSIDAAMHDWIYTTSRLEITTPISYTQTSVKTNSRMDLYYGKFFEPSKGMKGATYWFNGDGTMVPGGNGSVSLTGPTTNWVWCKIKLNNPNFSDLGSWDREGVVAHEMGHVFGLAHYASYDVIMWNYTATRKYNNARETDLDGINHLY